MELVGNLLSEIKYDGIVATSDLIAIGIIRQLLSHGIKVPDDLHLVGYDNVPLASYFIPSITTIAQPLDEICNCLVNLLFSAEDERTALETVFMPKLIIRET